MREFLKRGPDTPLSEAQMSAAPFSGWRGIGVVLTTLFGFGFFNVLIGVFGLLAAIIALVLFISLSTLIFRWAQPERTRS